MKKLSHLCILLAVSLIIILQIISGYIVTATEREVPEIEKLYRYKCSLCHPAPNIDECGYTYQQWIKVMSAMHQPGRYMESVNAEEDALLKNYIRIMSMK